MMPKIAQPKIYSKKFSSKPTIRSNIRPQIESGINNTFFKVTNAQEKHNGYQYHDGLNVLEEKFDSNKESTCGPGGFYFTDRDNIHKYYNYGKNLRLVSLPNNDKQFKMVAVDDKFRANKIILGPKYSLNDIKTYVKFGIKKPSLRDAVRGGFFAVLNNLVQNNTYDQHEIGQALVCAASEGKIEMVKYFIENNIVFCQNAINEAFHKAVSFDHIDIARYLINQHHNIDIHWCNDYALRYCNNVTMLKFLLQNDANIGADNNYLLRQKIMDGDFEMVKCLVEHGADIHVDDNFPIKYSARHGDLNTVKLLVRYGADIHAENDYALRWSSFWGFTKVVKFLVKKGANIHADNDVVIKNAATEGNWDLVKFLAEKGANYRVDNDFVFHKAVSYKSIDTINYLLSKGVEIHGHIDQIFSFKK